MTQVKIFQNTPIKEIDWTELKGGIEFLNSITENVPFNNLDELIESFTNACASVYSQRIQASGLCESAVKAELISKFQNTTSRYGVVLYEGAL